MAVRLFKQPRNLSLFAVLLSAIGVIIPYASFAQPQIEGCPLFPADNIWNVPIDTLPVDSNSNAYVSSIGATTRLKADFGSGTWNGGPIGIPFITVSSAQPLVNITFQYSSESDPGPYPIPPNAPIEGGEGSSGDRHVIVLERDSCTLYEVYDSHRVGNSWQAGSGAKFELRSHQLRPAGWTSADAAGLPILPGLVRYDEVAAGEINHAIRFTAPSTQRAYVWPGRHFASSSTNPALPPMGQRFRLKASVDISGYPASLQVILRALKRYGMILADNGSAWYMSGAPDERWDNDLLQGLGNLRGSDFEAVDVTSLQLSADSGQARVSTSQPRVKADFDGDGRSDIIVYRPGQGNWYILTSGSNFSYDSHVLYQLGLPGDIPLVGHVDSDSRADLTVWRPTTGEWFFRKSSESYAVISMIQWGLPSDVPLLGDYDGDGLDDLTIYRARSGAFYVLRSTGNYNRSGALGGNTQYLMMVASGTLGYDPVIGDFDGDGRDNFVTVFQLIRFWNVHSSTGQLLWSLPWGYPGDTPLGCDWDNDEVADRVIVRPTARGDLEWYVAGTLGVYTMNLGRNHHTPRCDRDFDGDGRLDQSLFDSQTGKWLLRDGQSGEQSEVDFGLPGDMSL